MTPGPPPSSPRWGLIVSVVLGLVGSAAVLGGIILTVSYASQDDHAPPPSASSPARTPEGPVVSLAPGTDQEMTETVTRLMWDEMTGDERTEVCVSLKMLGTDGIAEMMREGQSAKARREAAWDVDWDLAAQTIEAKCTEQGF